MGGGAGRGGRVLARGGFYTVADSGGFFVLEDGTRRGLEARERAVDAEAGAEADMGVVRGADGAGRRVPIRWFFPKGEHGLDVVLARAARLEERYAALRGGACPDGGGSDGGSRA